MTNEQGLRGRLQEGTSFMAIHSCINLVCLDGLVMTLVSLMLGKETIYSKQQQIVGHIAPSCVEDKNYAVTQWDRRTK